MLAATTLLAMGACTWPADNRVSSDAAIPDAARNSSPVDGDLADAGPRDGEMADTSVPDADEADADADAPDGMVVSGCAFGVNSRFEDGALTSWCAQAEAGAFGASVMTGAARLAPTDAARLTLTQTHDYRPDELSADFAFDLTVHRVGAGSRVAIGIAAVDGAGAHLGAAWTSFGMDCDAGALACDVVSAPSGRLELRRSLASTVEALTTGSAQRVDHYRVVFEVSGDADATLHGLGLRVPECPIPLPRAVAATGCLLHAELDGLAEDGSAGLCGAALTTVQATVAGEAVCRGALRTTDGGVSYETSEAFDIDAGLTIDLWVKASGAVPTNENGPILLDHGGGAFRVYLRSGAVAVTTGVVCGSGLPAVLHSGVALGVERWTHIQALISSAGVVSELVVDGLRRGGSTETRCARMSTASATVHVGHDGLGGRRFDGLVDGLRIRLGASLGESLTASTGRCAIDYACGVGGRVRDWSGACRGASECSDVLRCFSAATEASPCGSGAMLCEYHSSSGGLRTCSGEPIASSQCLDRIANPTGSGPSCL